MKQIFPGIFQDGERILTKNTVPSFRPFGEDTVKSRGSEFRVWNPCRSKLGAAIAKGISTVPIGEGSKVLYHGAAHGMTPTFVANIVGNSGIVYAVEFSERCFKDLLPLCDKYTNIVPILADSRKPELFSWIEKGDVVYVDIAQPDETEIAIRNCREFLKSKGYLMIAIKSRSIDITKSPGRIYKEEMEKIKRAGFEIVDWKTLDPMEKAHAFIVARSKD